MRFRHTFGLLFFLGITTLAYTQPDGKIRRPYLLSVTTNPVIPVVGHFNLMVDYRALPRHSFGVEYTQMGRALHLFPSTDSIPTLDNWLGANGQRFFLRWKTYPFFRARKLRLSRFYLSVQAMYRQIEFERAPISYTELLETYTKEVRERRQGGRLDFVLGSEIPFGGYFIVGAYAGVGLGMERVRQFNLGEFDVGNLSPPGQQFFDEEPDFFRNLISVRAGVVIGFILPARR